MSNSTHVLLRASKVRSEWRKDKLGGKTLGGSESLDNPRSHWIDLHHTRRNSHYGFGSRGRKPASATDHDDVHSSTKAVLYLYSHLDFDGFSEPCNLVTRPSGTDFRLGILNIIGAGLLWTGNKWGAALWILFGLILTFAAFNFGGLLCLIAGIVLWYEL